MRIIGIALVKKFCDQLLPSAKPAMLTSAAIFKLRRSQFQMTIYSIAPGLLAVLMLIGVVNAETPKASETPAAEASKIESAATEGKPAEVHRYEIDPKAGNDQNFNDWMKSQGIRIAGGAEAPASEPAAAASGASDSAATAAKSDVAASKDAAPASEAPKQVSKPLGEAEKQDL
jgi:hypothetical protein